MIYIEFTKDFASRKKGDRWECDGMLAADLINRKVAKKVSKRGPKPKKKVNESD